MPTRGCKWANAPPAVAVILLRADQHGRACQRGNTPRVDQHPGSSERSMMSVWSAVASLRDAMASNLAWRRSGGWLANRSSRYGCHARAKVGGPQEDRTPDLRIANAALSQLSWRPD